jgi:NAD(P)-dependent dehydrogenase (short-subunit alcohol dehydrogenase family)
MTSNAPQSQRRPPRLERTVVVTGGTRRLGRVISAALAEMGFDVAASYSDARLAGSAELAAFEADISSRHGVRCATVCADLSDPTPAAIARLFDACPSPLFGLVNNAGMFEWDNLASLTRAGVEATLAVNLVAPMLVTSEFARRIADATGVAVFMLDQKIFNPYPDHLTYTVSKGAAHMLLEMCAREPGRDIKFYGLAPGLTLPAPGQSKANFHAAQASVPLGVSPQPDEIAVGVQFLFCGTAANGHVLVIDGGACLVQRERDFEFFDAGNG